MRNVNQDQDKIFNLNRLNITRDLWICYYSFQYVVSVSVAMGDLKFWNPRGRPNLPWKRVHPWLLRITRPIETCTGSLSLQLNFRESHNMCKWVGQKPGYWQAAGSHVQVYTQTLINSTNHRNLIKFCSATCSVCISTRLVWSTSTVIGTDSYDSVM